MFFITNGVVFRSDPRTQITAIEQGTITNHDSVLYYNRVYTLYNNHISSIMRNLAN